MISASLKALLGAALVALAAGASAQKTQLTVYTALETDQLKAYEAGFNEGRTRTSRSSGCATRPASSPPSCWPRRPTRRPTSSWASPPRAWRCSTRRACSMPYAPLNLDAIMAAYRDKKSPPAWFGMDVWGATVCFNTVEAQKKDIPKPETWKDLTKPVYKGQIVMPNPASSGTGYFDVTAWLHALGRRQRQGRRLEVHGRAAREHRAVHALGLEAVQHGGAPASSWSASRSSTAPTRNKAKGAPIDLVFPKEGLGWDLEAFAIHKGTKKLEAAKKLADWASSKDAMQLYGKNFAIIAQPGRRRAAGQRAGRLREAPGQDGLRVRRREPRAHPRRVEQALQRASPSRRSEPLARDRRRIRLSSVHYLRLEGIRKAFGRFEALQATSTWRSRRASSSASSAPRAAARRRCCASSPGSRRRPPAASCRAGATSRGCRRPSATTASSSSRTRCSRTCRSPTTSPTASSTARSPKAQIAARVDELLKLVGLPGSGAKFPAQLSGGQQQRIALARALATSPGLLLLDEPLSALDALVRVRLRGEIRTLQQQLGVTTIMVTHDQEEALSMADRIVVMNQGVIEQVGTPMRGLPRAGDAVRRRLRRQDQRARRPRCIRAATCAIGAQPVRVRARQRRRARRQGLPAARGRRSRGRSRRATPTSSTARSTRSSSSARTAWSASRAEAIGAQPLTVYLSLNYLAEQGLEVGSRLPLRLLPERMRFF